MKILIAEDDRSSRQILEIMIMRNGHKPVSAKDGQEAYEILQKENAPKIAILDWEMPKMSGLELIKKLEKSRKSLYILMLTAKSKKEDLIEGLETGADDYLHKPYDPEELKARLKVGMRIIKAEEDLKEKLQQIKLSEKKFKNILKNMQSIYIRTDLKGNFVLCNQLGRDLLEISEDMNLKGINFFENIQNQDAEEIKDILINKKENINNKEFKFKKMNGADIFVYGSINLFIDYEEPKKGFEISFADITEMKNISKAKNKLEKELNRAKKLETIGTLAGGIAHELNNNLTPVIGYIEALYDNYSKDKFLQNSLQEIMKNSQEAVELVKKILIFDRNTGHDFEKLSLTKLLEDCLSNLKTKYNKNYQIDLNLDKSHVIKANFDNLKKAFCNILDNAVYALNEDNGTITIKSETLELNNELLSLYPSLKAENNYISLLFKDNGKGISKNDIDRVFEPFFTTKSIGDGKGLGLTESHGIIKGHNGIILLESNEEIGTEIKVILPIILENTEIKEDKSKNKIILITDENETKSLFQNFFTESDTNLIVVSNQLEFFEKYLENLKQFVCIISDLKLINGNGLEIVHKVKALKKDLPFIILNNMRNEIRQKLVKDETIDQVFNYPIEGDEVLKFIGRFL